MNYEPHPQYEKLPEPIKRIYSPKEYAWMNDKQRANLEYDECTPERDFDE